MTAIKLIGRAKMFRLLGASTVAALALTACVTINVYFPAAEAREAAKGFVERVLDQSVQPAKPEGGTNGGMALELPRFDPLMLIGIATKNSILLVDYAVVAEDKHGLSLHDALIDACRKRARPVIMTTLAMGAGMLPLALGLSGDSSFRAPMAWAVIGGLITSTALSLIVIPAAYSVLHDVGLWIARKFRRGATAAHADA